MSQLKMVLVVALTTIVSSLGRHEADTPSRFLEMPEPDFIVASEAGYVREATDEERKEFEQSRASVNAAAAVAEQVNDESVAEVAADSSPPSPRGSKRKA